MIIKPWSQLTDYRTPAWLREKKFGIYTHWGIYSVPAFGPNVSWYPYRMYLEGSPQFEHHCKTYGHPSKFGYKDFISMFTAEKFDADEWAALFKKSGAGFAGPVAEHHDGFSMWKSAVNPWCAANMGPKRDVVGELEKAIRAQGMEFMVAFHHMENWMFYPHWVKEYDTSDPAYAGLYGPAHNTEWGSEQRFQAAPAPKHFTTPLVGAQDIRWIRQDRPSKEFHDLWFEKIREVVDGYHPDYIWFDFGLQFTHEAYKRKFLTYYRQQAAARGQEVAISYKWSDLPMGTAMVDVEQGRFAELPYHDWITDTTVDAGEAWGYMKDATYKTSKSLVHYLVDNVSKNGYLLLNVGPKPDGTIPDEARRILEDIGAWLAENGECIYGAEPFTTPEEGPTKTTASGAFSEMQDVAFTPRDLRFTAKDNIIYCIALGDPGDEVRIENFWRNYIRPEDIVRVTALGDDKPLPTRWADDRAFVVDTRFAKKNDVATVLRIERRDPLA